MGEIADHLIEQGLDWACSDPKLWRAELRRDQEQQSIEEFNREIDNQMKHAIWNASGAKLWLNCGEYTRQKIKAEALGLNYNPSSIHSIRGTALHDVAEATFRQWAMGKPVDREAAITASQAEHKHEFTDKDREQLEIAFTAAVNLASQYGDDAQFLIEKEVILPHEPESNGYVDLGMLLKKQRNLVVADYKFGRGEVDPYGEQNRIYAMALMALLEAKINFIPSRVVLAIIQPALYRDAKVFVASVEDLQHWYTKTVIPEVERQRAGEFNGAKELSVCDNFCPFQDDCTHRAGLIREQLGIVEKTPLSDSEIEYLARNKSAIEKVLKTCATTVANETERFPNWHRYEVNNARSWNELMDPGEIGHRLNIEGNIDDAWVLDTPAKIRDRHPETADLVQELTQDNGHHLRMRYGVKDTKKEAEPKRPAAKKKAAKKKSAVKKKAAKTKSASKKAAKKATK